MSSAQEISTPAWSQGVLWYQIFPDRFRNGDTTNDPTLQDIAGCWPHDDSSAWRIMPWTADWYALQSWEAENGKGFQYNVQRRRYGGDLQGIIDALPYLDSLGVGALYLNPVFMAPSLHKYDAAMYHHIEPTFGPDPEGDKALIASEDPLDPATWHWTSADKLALQLIGVCHARNIRIIFDGVFNHMGINSFAFRDVMKNREASKYRDWFLIEDFGDVEAGTPLKYTGWFGAADLPEFKEDSLGIVSGPRDYIFQCTERWMAPDGDVRAGIDGWRLDVAFCVDMDFWRDWRKHVKQINPDAYLTAEINADTAVLPYIRGDAFDAVMHYSFAALAQEFFMMQAPIKVTTFYRTLLHLQEIYGADISLSMMNLFDSHDTPRFTSVIKNDHVVSMHTWGDFFQATRSSNPEFNTRKPDAADLQTQKLMAMFQFTWPGAPMIYYGDEAGMWGANDPDCRKPMLWQDMQYAPEKYLSDGTLSGGMDPVTVDTALLNYYRALGTLHAQNDALKTGALTVMYANNRKQVLVYSRTLQESNFIIVMNKSNRNQRIRIAGNDSSYYLTYFHHRGYKPHKGKMEMVIPAKSGFIMRELKVMSYR